MIDIQLCEHRPNIRGKAGWVAHVNASGTTRCGLVFDIDSKTKRQVFRKLMHPTTLRILIGGLGERITSNGYQAI
jgi:hypothetical protein